MVRLAKASSSKRPFEQVFHQLGPAPCKHGPRLGRPGAQLSRRTRSCFPPAAPLYNPSTQRRVRKSSSCSRARRNEFLTWSAGGGRPRVCVLRPLSAACHAFDGFSGLVRLHAPSRRIIRRSPRTFDRDASSPDSLLSCMRERGETEAQLFAPVRGSPGKEHKTLVGDGRRPPKFRRLQPKPRSHTLFVC